MNINSIKADIKWATKFLSSPVEDWQKQIENGQLVEMKTKLIRAKNLVRVLEKAIKFMEE